MKKLNLNIKGKKGITIVSLVITVILIILIAAIAINVFSGEKNIIDAAKESADTHEIARISEKLELLKGPILIDKAKVDIKTYMDALGEKEPVEVTDVKWNEDSNYAYVTVDGKYTFLVEDRLDGNVIITYNGVPSELTLSEYERTAYHPNTITFEVTKNQSGGALSVKTLNEDVAVATIQGNKITVQTKKVGTTDIIVKSEKTEEYGEGRARYTLTVKEGKLGVVATGYSGVYDGKPHSISVTSEVTGVKITYSTSKDGTYSATNPTYSDAGTYTVYYKVEKDGFEPVTGVFEKVEITKAEGKVTLSEKSGTITYPNVGTFTVTENLSDGDLRVESSNREIATASIDNNNKVTVKPEGKSGKVIITVTSEATKNYNEAKATYEMTVENGTLNVTATGYSGAYDGNDHGIQVTCTTTGGTITYSDKEDGTFTGTNPTYRNVGNYTTYYKVEKPGYTTATGNKTIEITKAEGKVTLSEPSGLAVYGEEKTFKVTENLSQGSLSVKSSNENIAKATISGTTITIEPGLEVGKATITVTSAETTNYKEAQATYEIDVKANENTPYKVIHQKMKLDETYETVETEEKTGEALTKVTPDVKTYEGFKAPAKQEITIAVDGSTTITYKYERNKYAFTLGSASEIKTDGSSTSGNYYYGQQITLKATVNEGYTWSKWLSNNTSLVSNKDAANTTFTMPAGAITMTPSVTENTYTIAFNANGGSGTIASMTGIKYTETKTLTANTFTRAGYTFAGWNTKQDGTGTNYSDKAQVSKLTNVNGATITLYAKWTIVNYTISYDLAGGTVETANPTTYNVNTANITLNNPTKTGYTFAGWTGSNGNTPQTSVTIAKGSTGNKTYTANWEINNYYVDLNMVVDTVTYGSSDGYEGRIQVGLKIGGEDKGYRTDYYVEHPYNTTWEIYGLKLDGVSVPYTQSGKTITGITRIKPEFYTLNIAPNNSSYGTVSQTSVIVPNNSTTYTTNSNVLTLSDKRTVTATATTLSGYTTTFSSWSPASGTITEKTNVTANFARTENIYTIAFNANGGTGTMASISNVKYTESKTLTANAFTREGYTFAGWNTKADGTGTNYANSASVNKLTEANGATVTLYAKWTENTYNIAFNANGGTGTMTSISNVKYSAATTLTANAFTREGYTFAGWNTKQDGTGTSYGNSASVSKLTTTNGATVTLYAKWTANTYTLTVNPNGGTYNGTTSNTTISGTYDSRKNVGTPSAAPAGYTVTFDGNGATAPSSQTSTKTFSSWTKSGTGEYVAGSNASVSGMTRTVKTESGETYENFTYTASSPTADTWYYLRYPAYTYTPGSTYQIRFKLRINSMSNTTMGFRHSALANDYGTPGLMVERFTTVTNGWKEVVITRTFSGTTTTLNSNTVNIAPVFEVYTDNLNGKIASGSFDIKDLMIINKTTGKILQSNSNLFWYRAGNSTLTANYTNNSITLPSISRNGYTFNGWYTAATGGTRVGGANDKYTPTAAIKLFAQWTENSYNIAFNANGGSGSMASISNVKYTAATTLTANTFTKAGYTFAGWNTKADGTGTNYANSASVSKLTEANGATVTLYAKWTENSYNIAFNANGGSGTMSNISNVKYTASTTLTANAFTKEGYTFAGWNTKADGTGTNYANSASVSKLTEANGATITLYAKWNARTAVSTLKVGDYVKYTVPYKSYTVSVLSSGTSSAQDFNTSSYTGLWRVLYNDSNGLQLISDSTVINLDISGKVGYNNLFTTLNTVSNNYVNSTYAVSGRSVGSSPSTTASTADTTSLYANSTYSFVAKYANDLKIADTKYTSDETALRTNNMLNVANKDYWMASRYIYSSADGVGFHGLVVGTFNDYTGLASVLLKCAHVDGEVHDHKHTAGVRPVVKLNTNVKVKAGSGTSSSPWELTV